jgi:hypothetical protein
MKAKIRKTGEIVDVISYCGDVSRNATLDCVSYIDSQGIEHEKEKLNYFWDFEEVEITSPNDIDWEQRKYEIAKEAMLRMIDPKMLTQKYGLMAKNACEFANELVNKLKEHI